MFYSSTIRNLCSIVATLFAIVTMFYPGKNIEANPVEPIADGADVRVMTFNLRCTGFNKTSIQYRSSLICKQINETKADSMGFQEANLLWMDLLEEYLDENYAFVGTARFDGDVLGEYSPIFYRADKYDVIDSGTFWLSKTPDVPGSRDWGSNRSRICTWAVLKNKSTGEAYAHLNTHLDHISALAREEQMKVLLTKVSELIGEYPIVVTGDFNDTNNSVMYNEISEVLTDSRLLAPVTDTKPIGTYHNYGEKDELIDFIFVSDNITPMVYHVIDDKLNDVYLSDHYGIYVDFSLN